MGTGCGRIKTQQTEVCGEEQSDVFPASRVTACLAFPAAEITKLATRRRTDGIAMRVGDNAAKLDWRGVKRLE
jgi:hypothetical protein